MEARPLLAPSTAPAPLDITTLREGYRSGSLSVAAVVESVLQRLPDWRSHNIWIRKLEPEAIRARAAQLDRLSPKNLPLYGIPFAVKDNIDVAGLPTTAAYPEPLYVAERNAAAVQHLLDAGAVLIGKTNLDQFATGLNGTRSPYGACANAFDSSYISGGSSSGSAVALAAGLVSFALGTDTAGSGRVPAAFNNLVGLKPTRGLVSTRGVVPACRSLDCVSLLALTVPDSLDVLRVLARYDELDPFARPAPSNAQLTLRPSPPYFRFAVPSPDQLEFFGDEHAQRLFEQAATKLEALGGKPQVIDMSPFLEAAELLYAGPWVAERGIAVREYLGDGHARLLPVLQDIIDGASSYSASEGFEAFYRLKTLKRQTENLWKRVDVLVTPTAGTIFTIEEMQHDPVRLNNRLGYYTNFVNLLDLSALAVPAGFLPNGLPFGLTLLAPAFQEARLVSLGVGWQQATNLGMGRSKHPPPAPVFNTSSTDSLDLFVCGAHMEGLALNMELAGLGAHLVRSCRTAPIYRFYALEEFTPARPGLVHGDEGCAVEGEVWRIPIAEVGRFIAGIPAPLGIGKVALEDGTWVSGFICEGYASARGRDISSLGGWRAYLASQQALPA